RYITHFVGVWRDLLLPEVSTNVQTRLMATQFEDWLRKHLTENSGYDQLVRELLTAPMSPETTQIYRGGPMAPSPAAFYVAKELKPENLAASTSRTFLGVRLECAQCHNHPFADWKRDQFWSYAAFFAGIQRREQGGFVSADRESRDKREITVPGTERIVQASFLDGSEPQFKYE